MTISTPVYCTREDVKRALDSKQTARNNTQVDRALEASARFIEGLTHRRFYPEVATRYFDWPNPYSRAWRLWLDDSEVISVTSLTAGGTVIPSTDYFLEPVNTGPPYNRVEIDLASSAAFASGATHQRSVEVAGVFGYQNTEAPAGNLAEDLDNSETGVDVTNSALIGVGSLIKVDSERMLVTDKTMLDTTQNLQTSLTADKNNVTVAVSNGTTFAVDEVILIDSERMLIVDISANNLTVIRAWDGTVLAAHTAPTADIFAPRTLTVVRAALGTTAATHSTAAAIVKHLVPSGVRDLAVAEAMTELGQETSQYGQEVGSGDNTRVPAGKGIGAMRDQVYTQYGRKARSWAA